MTDKVEQRKTEMVDAAESLGISQEEYDNIVDECIFGKEEPVSEDMWEVSKQYALRQVLASTDEEMSEQDYLNLRLFSGFELAVAHKDGAVWQKEQMMAKAIDGLVVCDELTYGYKDIAMGIPSFLNVGDEVKVIIIKQK